MEDKPPVYKGHSREPENVPFIDNDLLYRGALKSAFDCIYNIFVLQCTLLQQFSSFFLFTIHVAKFLIDTCT